ncbi:MAG: Ig-like domain-containing protein [Lachnospiraceae bacterium]|nr:Ig-like domain-containing protein [Lachnospiraceae bacterium]
MKRLGVSSIIAVVLSASLIVSPVGFALASPIPDTETTEDRAGEPEDSETAAVAEEIVSEAGTTEEVTGEPETFETEAAEGGTEPEADKTEKVSGEAAEELPAETDAMEETSKEPETEDVTAAEAETSEAGTAEVGSEASALNETGETEIQTAAVSGTLLIEINGKTVTDAMKLEDVTVLFGEPKLITDSFWGGKACTFYGENYSDFLYLETYADGLIAAFGSMTPGFQTATVCYDDRFNLNQKIPGEAQLHDGLKICAYLGYSNLEDGWMDVWYADAAENNKNLNLHVVEMWNAFSWLYGNQETITFNENAFYMNQQLADNCSDLYRYCELNAKEEFFLYSYESGETTDYGTYKYPNPMEFISSAATLDSDIGYASAAIVRKTADGADYRLVGLIDCDFFVEKKIVEYTEEEKQQLQQAKGLYSHSVSVYNEGYDEGYFLREPQYETIPLDEGEINPKVLQGAVDYINAIRAGAGLSLLKYSEELMNAAQCKATLTKYYAFNNLENPNPHFPAQPEGLDDAFYAKTQLGTSENLFMAGFFGGSVITSLLNALDDTAGSGQYYERGHRYVLLNPYAEFIGVGTADIQGCHKLSGSVSSDVDVVAWPSKGIMPKESGFSSDTMMTCRFYNGYIPASDTIVTVTCLNTDEVWTIDSSQLQSGQDFFVNGKLISYMDTGISFTVGNIYQITFDHLRDSSGTDVSYSYRSVFESIWTDCDALYPEEIRLSDTAVTMLKGDTVKVQAKLSPVGIAHAYVGWKSSDTGIATVNANGYITGISGGTVTIEAITANGISATCIVTVVDPGENYTGLAECGGTWYYVTNGVKDSDFTGLTKYNNSWYYVKNGVLDWSFTGLCKNLGIWFYVKNGKVDWSYTGLCKHNGAWFYVAGGMLDWSFTGLTKYNGAWFYVENGMLNWNYTGLCKNNGIWFYVNGGMVDWSYTGLCRHNGMWFYVAGGMLDWNFTGVTKYNGVWFYVENGMLNWNYTGLVKNNGVWYYVDGGMIDWNYSGTVTQDGIKYEVIGGYVR